MNNDGFVIYGPVLVAAAAAVGELARAGALLTK